VALGAGGAGACAGGRGHPAGTPAQRRADGTARQVAGAHACPAAGLRARPAAAAAARKRNGPRPGRHGPDRDGPRQRADHACGRVAARQLPSGRGADPHGPAAPAAGLQPRTAVAGIRAFGRHAAGVRPGGAGHRPRRRPRRRREPEPLCRRLPVDRPAQPGRAVGDPDHAAPGPDRQPAPGRRAADRRPQRPQRRRPVVGPPDRNRRGQPQGPGAGDRRHGAFESAGVQLVRRRTGAAPAGSQRRPGDAADLGRAVAVGVGAIDRADGARREPAAGRGPGLDKQQHRQPALPGHPGLARVRRGDQPGRLHPAPGPRRPVRADGLRHPRQLPALGRTDRPARPDGRAAGRRPGAGPGPRRRRSGRQRRAAGPCRPLPGGRRPARTGGQPAAARRQAPGARDRAIAGASGLHRLRCRDRGRVHLGDARPRPAGAGLGRPGAGRRPVRARLQRAGGRPGQLVRDLGGAADGPAAAGLHPRHSLGNAHPGRGADDARQRRRHRRAGRKPGGALPGQPRRQPALRPAHRPAGCRRGHHSRRRRAGRRRPPGHRAAEPPLRARRRRPLLPVPPAAPVQCQRGRVDGPRAQARQTRRAQRLPARRRPQRLCRNRRRHPGAGQHPLRDHPGHRHPAAARRCPRAGRHPGPPAQPRAAGSAAAHRHRRLRHPAAARGHQHERPAALALRCPVRQRAGHRSVHAGGVRRLSRPVRGRLVRRQGHLRRRRLRGDAGRADARQPHPQPRPAGGLLRPRRPGQRRAAVRGLPVQLPAGHQAPAPLDPRRLAAAALAAAAGAAPPTAAASATRCRCCRAASCWTTCAAAWCRWR
jgi:hypothetical protein